MVRPLRERRLVARPFQRKCGVGEVLRRDRWHVEQIFFVVGSLIEPCVSQMSRVVARRGRRERLAVRHRSGGAIAHVGNVCGIRIC